MTDAEIVFLDVEASGLGQGSFPIEVGWAFLLGTSNSRLIKPAPTWDIDLWDEQAEGLHKITLDQLQSMGSDPRDVAELLNQLLAPPDRALIVLSDAVDMDSYWLDTLFEETPEPRRFLLHDEARARKDRFRDLSERAIISKGQPDHRAESDAQRLAQRWRSLMNLES